MVAANGAKSTKHSLNLRKINARKEAWLGLLRMFYFLKSAPVFFYLCEENSTELGSLFLLV